MAMTPKLRYPAGPVTPHGAYHILHDRVPQFALRSYDDSAVFHMMGGLAIPDRTMPERVEVTAMKGLISPWKTIDQKGATQDGVTFVDALYDPTEVELEVKVHGRDPAHTRKVYRHLIESIDAKKESTLSWFTHELGYWWAPVRWFDRPENPMRPINHNIQDVSLRLRADSAFWRSYDSVTEFRFTYEDSKDTFDTDDLDDLGTGWTVAYPSGTTGNISVVNGMATWVESGTTARTMVARKNSFTTTTDNQVAEMQLGSFAEWIFAPNAYNDLWVRMNESGTPGTSGVRLRIAAFSIKLSYFAAGVETVIRDFNFLNPLTWIPPLPGEKWTLIAGEEGTGNERLFKVLRNGAAIMTVKESGTGSPLGAGNRAVGLGMEAGAGSTQVSPAAVTQWNAGDNATVSQSGFLERINAGDQEFFDRYTCFGPGIFRFANGPGSSDMVEFGPLLPNQVMYIRTDPRKRGVIDLTSTPPTPQQLDIFQQALKDFISFATGNNVPPLLQEIQSIFGILPPQGNPYSLLHGRFSDAAAIPAKSPGQIPEVYHVRVEIDDGNASSKIIASGTPLRRLPY